MSEQSKEEESRRQFLLSALRLGILGSAGSLLPMNAGAELLGKVPRKMPAGQSIYELLGKATINGSPATAQSAIGNNDLIETGDNSQLIFAVGHDAFILRANSSLKLSGEDNLLVSGLRLVTGALLSVFGKSRHQINTPTAIVGIRGTGVYVEADPELSYICTCYGTTEIAAVGEPDRKQTITTTHHDDAKYVLASGNADKLIRKAPFKNHSDMELTLIETLVGRTPPFGLFDDGYDRPRRY